MLRHVEAPAVESGYRRAAVKGTTLVLGGERTPVPVTVLSC
jgi:hypothetical protein